MRRRAWRGRDLLHFSEFLVRQVSGDFASINDRERAILMSAANKHIQPGYTTITPYLYAKLDLIDFIKNAFGAEVTHTPTPDAKGQFHAEAKIGDAHLLFGNGYFSDPSIAAAISIYVHN